MNIIWKKPDNTLAVTSIFDGSDPEEHAQLLKDQGNIPADWIPVATSVDEFPAYWNRQEDWRVVSGRIVVDMECAKETTRSRLRVERAPLLAALDVQFQRCIEEASSTDAVVAEKRRLRDITCLVDSCSTLDELKALSCV